MASAYIDMHEISNHKLKNEYGILIKYNTTLNDWKHSINENNSQKRLRAFSVIGSEYKIVESNYYLQYFSKL